MTRYPNKLTALKTALLVALALALVATPLRSQTPRAGFLADHYDVSANLDTIGQSISAVAKVDFKAQEVSSAVRVELHQNLEVKDVKGADGRSLSFERDNQNPLSITVTLPAAVAAGARVT